MSRIIVKLSVADIGNLLLGGTVSMNLDNFILDGTDLNLNIPGVDVELNHYGCSNAEVED